MEVAHRERYVRKGTELLCHLQVHHSPGTPCHWQPGSSVNLLLLGFLLRLPHVGMINY